MRSGFDGRLEQHLIELVFQVELFLFQGFDFIRGARWQDRSDMTCVKLSASFWAKAAKTTVACLVHWIR